MRPFLTAKLSSIFICRLTIDFHVNKRILDEVALIQTKRLRNKIAGYTTWLMKRIQKGPVRGISLRLQEEVSFACDSFFVFANP